MARGRSTEQKACPNPLLQQAARNFRTSPLTRRPGNSIITLGNVTPTISEEFKQQLRAYDPTLYVSWNSIQQRFVIEQCIRHFAATPEHTHICDRTYVWVVQGDDNCMLPLGGHVIDKIRSIDNEKKGYGPNDLAKYINDFKTGERTRRAKIEADMADAVKHASRFNRRQLLRAIHLMQQHSLEPNR